MSKWRSRTMMAREAIKEYRLDEAAEALVEVLHGHETWLQKPVVAQQAANYCESSRRHDGVLYMPTIEGRLVKPPDVKFIIANWSDLTKMCAASGFYVVWETGRGGGVRLGTLEEYRECLNKVEDIISGSVDSHNVGAGLVRSRGKRATDLELRRKGANDGATDEPTPE